MSSVLNIKYLYAEDMKNAITVLWGIHKRIKCLTAEKKVCKDFFLEEYSLAHDNCYWQKIISSKLQDVSYKKNL